MDVYMYICIVVFMYIQYLKRLLVRDRISYQVNSYPPRLDGWRGVYMSAMLVVHTFIDNLMVRAAKRICDNQIKPLRLDIPTRCNTLWQATQHNKRD
jgi:hypothetical protein